LIIFPRPLIEPVISPSINFKIINTNPPHTIAPAIGNPTSVTSFKNSSTNLFIKPVAKSAPRHKFYM